MTLARDHVHFKHWAQLQQRLSLKQLFVVEREPLGGAAPSIAHQPLAYLPLTMRPIVQRGRVLEALHVGERPTAALAVGAKAIQKLTLSALGEASRVKASVVNAE